mgnify:CR=1 FL=1
MKEVLRKIGLVANWAVIGGSGIILTGVGLFADAQDDMLFLVFGIPLIITAFIIHKVLNWIFE